MKRQENIFVFGASGHAKVVIDIIERAGLYQIAFLVDDNPKLKGLECYGYPIVGGKSELLDARLAGGPISGIVAIGSNSARQGVASWLEQNHFLRITAIHPAAQVARGVQVGQGTVVMANAVINSDSTLGCEVIINTGATVDHDCVIGNSVHIAPGATLCGTVNVGDGTFICSGAVIIPNLSIGEGVIVGAGATVVRNLPDKILAAGTPARILREI